MIRKIDSFGWRWLLYWETWLFLWLPVAAISVAHYTTGASHHWLHDIFRRLYYIPIVLGAFQFGIRGALAASLMASLIYAPHAFTSFFVHDPTRGMEKVLEILLYNVIALITGTLADREYRERRRQEKTARRLSETLEEMKFMEQQLIRSGKLQALGELTAGLAHEIKNPLASLKGATEILADEIPLDSPRRKMVEILHKELDRLHDLLERFMSFARPASYDKENFDLRQLIEKTIAVIQSQAKHSGIRLIYQAPAEPIFVWGNQDKISQVLLNLLLNAIQASPQEKEVLVSCDVLTRGKHRYSLFSVQDSGPGVPPEIQDKIFNPLFTTKSEGTGLGLSIAARIVDEHDGLIETENPPAGGAIFHVYLPIRD